VSISPRDRLIVTIAVAIVIVLALVALLIYPQFRELGDLNSQVVEANAQADAARLQLEERRGFKDRAIETNAKWLRLMNQVPDTPDLPSLIIELQDVAFASGVQLVVVQPAAVVPKDTYAAVPVSVEILGTWSDTVDYLEALPKLDRGVRLTSVNVKLVSAGGDVTRRTAKLPAYSVDTLVNMEAYLIPSESAPASPTPAPTTPAQ
jgi:type IV pilus assembly protein PilO